MDSFLARLGLLSLAGVLLGGTVLGIVLSMGGIEPRFYQQALQTPPQELQAAHRSFVQAAAELERELQQENQWQAEFTQEQLNGWLASELPGWLAEHEIEEFEQPRLQLVDGRVQLACRWRHSSLSGIVVLECRPIFDPAAESLSLEILDVRSGWLPIATSRWLTPVQDLTANINLPARWDVSSGLPTLHLLLKDRLYDERGPLSLQSLTISDGRIRISGTRSP